jgi:hypothetical protein
LNFKSFKSTTLSTIVDDIKSVNSPVLLIDDWISLFFGSWWWSKSLIERKIAGIFASLDSNPFLRRAVFVCTDHSKYLPFLLYKKRALWIILLFKRAVKITRMEYGVPILIKRHEE